MRLRERGACRGFMQSLFDSVDKTWAVPDAMTCIDVLEIEGKAAFARITM